MDGKAFDLLAEKICDRRPNFLYLSPLSNSKVGFNKKRSTSCGGRLLGAHGHLWLHLGTFSSVSEDLQNRGVGAHAWWPLEAAQRHLEKQWQRHLEKQWPVEIVLGFMGNPRFELNTLWTSMLQCWLVFVPGGCGDLDILWQVVACVSHGSMRTVDAEGSMLRGRWGRGPASVPGWCGGVPASLPGRGNHVRAGWWRNPSRRGLVWIDCCLFPLLAWAGAAGRKIRVHAL